MAITYSPKVVNGLIANENGEIDGVVPNSLNLTIVGTPFKPLVLALQPPIILATMSGINVSPLTKVIYDFTFNESGASTMITNLSFNDLEGVVSNFSPTNMTGLTALSLPTLSTIGGNFSPNNLILLNIMYTPLLENLGGNLNIYQIPSLIELSFPSLRVISSDININIMTSLQTIIMTSLTSCGNFHTNYNNLSSLTTLNLLSLVSVNGFYPYAHTLTTLNLPNLTTIGGGGFSPNMNSLVTLNIPMLSNCTTFAPTFNSLTTLTINTLNSTSAFSPKGSLITSLNISSTSLSGFSPSYMALTSYTNTTLVTIGGSGFAINNIPLTILSFTNLTTIAGNFDPNALHSVTTFNFPLLSTTSVFRVSYCELLTSLSFPSLTTTGQININNMVGLTSISLPSLINVGSEIRLNGSNGNIQNLTIGTLGTTKNIAGDLYINGQKLTLVSVEGILSVLASLDGTNGTTVWGSGKILNISGGTSVGTSSLSSQGLADKATILARGVSISMN